MESRDRFDLEEAIAHWVKDNCTDDKFLPEDKLEYGHEIEDMIRGLVEDEGLSERKAFAAVSAHMLQNTEYKEQMAQANEDNFQLKKVVLIFGGVIFYIFSYHFILCANRLLLLFSNYVNGNIEQNVANTNTFFNLVYVITLAAMVAVYFWHKPAKWLFVKITSKTRNNVLIVFATLFVVGLKMYLTPQVRNFVDDGAYCTLFFNKEITFQYIHFIIITVSYLLLFRKYTNKFSII